MKKFTKKQRHEIYIKALEVLKSGKGINHRFLCYALDKVTDDTPSVTGDEDALKHFYPEIYALKPQEPYGVFWWAVSDVQARINAFKTAIKQTE